MFWLRLFKLTLKKYLHTIVYAILGAIVPLIIIGTIVFCVLKSYDNEDSIVKGKVGVVTEDINDEYMDFAMNYLENMASTSEALEFIQMDNEEAAISLKKGEIIASIYFPAGIVDGILYGENIPAKITFNNNSSLSSILLTEITKAGVKLLSGAQAGTYTISELYYSLDCQNELNKAFNDVDMLNFTFVLSREYTFKTVNLSLEDIERTARAGTNSDKSDRLNIRNRRNTASPLINYYTASALLIFLLILGASFVKFFQKESDSFYSLLLCKKMAGIVFGLYTYLIYFINIFIITLTFFLLIQKNTNYNFEINGASLIYILIASMLISSFTYFISNLTNNSFATILLLFLSGFAFPFISGALIPSSFLPDKLSIIANYLPFIKVHEFYINILNETTYASTVSTILWSSFFILIGTICSYVKIRRASKWILKTS